MISIAFKSDYNDNNITKLSLISETETFVYGLFEDDLLVESGRFPIEDYDVFMKDYESHRIKKFFASKSKSFTHVDNEGLKAMKPKTQHQEVLNKNPEIHCCYNDSNLASNVDALHFSTLIHNHYKHYNNPVAFLYFGKNKLTICVSGECGFKFYNEFEIESPADVIYFTKAVLQNTSVDESRTIAIVGGYIEEGSEIYKMLYRHFMEVEKAKSPNFNVINDEIRPHSYFDHKLNVSR
jgi:hypothetical protein